MKADEKGHEDGEANPAKEVVHGDKRPDTENLKNGGRVHGNSPSRGYGASRMRAATEDFNG